jgi:hypothetical protein
MFRDIRIPAYKGVSLENKKIPDSSGNNAYYACCNLY